MQLAQSERCGSQQDAILHIRVYAPFPLTMNGVPVSLVTPDCCLKVLCANYLDASYIPGIPDHPA